ncbi:hypothetical protein [Actinocrispum wychmicini]|uniref:hypothetical protein n=1 Tax=Actinocrispum wychmicini TaxID=1213861 RepID=UPI00104F9C39|nr:hypothetical protein [Actinocrispum wychmicini]
MSADAIFDDLALTLASRGAVAGAMFGKRALKANGKAFACLQGDVLAFRLGAGSPAHDDALALAGAELFDPSGTKRPFKDWVAVPSAHAGQWPRLAETALGHLS